MDAETREILELFEKNLEEIQEKQMQLYDVIDMVKKHLPNSKILFKTKNNIIWENYDEFIK